MTIFNWHESCRRPDVKFNEGLGVPACSSCGCIAALEGIPATDSSMRVAAPYEPLFARKIRLLKLLKGNYNDPIRVELQVADLTIKPEYEALSYTWADEKKDSSRCEKIYIGERWDILLVTENCFNALRRLRFSYRSRRLWVDAICINQNDAGERSHQVGMMQSIYATATRVLIYLGENSKDEDTTSSSPWNFDIWNERSLPRDRDLTQEPYFKRVWVIQEIAAAQNPWLQNWFHVLPQGKLMDLQELPRLLQATALCKATDPRDRVYALLGLFQGAKQAQLIADYSLSVDQVF
ncbi:heterokaryon incompatibility protein-domain-containing protein, partial [Colletotrichum lupini]